MIIHYRTNLQLGVTNTFAMINNFYSISNQIQTPLNCYFRLHHQKWRCCYNMVFKWMLGMFILWGARRHKVGHLHTYFGVAVVQRPIGSHCFYKTRYNNLIMTMAQLGEQLHIHRVDGNNVMSQWWATETGREWWQRASGNSITTCGSSIIAAVVGLCSSCCHAASYGIRDW